MDMLRYETYIHLASVDSIFPLKDNSVNLLGLLLSNKSALPFGKVYNKKKKKKKKKITAWKHILNSVLIGNLHL